MKRFKARQTYPLFILILSVFLISGCGGGGGGTENWEGNTSGTGTPGAGTPGAGAPSTVIIPGAVCTVAVGATIPTVTSSDPTSGNQFVTTSTSGVAPSKLITATFSLAMNPATINSASPGALSTFTLIEKATGNTVSGTVAMNATNKIATFTTSAALSIDTEYTATITLAATSATGVAISCGYAWDFKTATLAATGAAPVDLLTAARFGTFGGSAGMTNTGNLTVITGSGGNTADIGTISVSNGDITGFHERTGDLLLDDRYTDTLGADSGQVTGSIYTCTNSTTGPNSAVNLAPATANASDCALATQARLDAEAAYIALAAMPSDGPLAGNLANTTITPGVYTNATSVMIQGGDLTLDAGGDANGVFVFQIGSTLLVGGPGAAAPQSIILAGGAQAKNIFWQVGTAATINAAGGGTMEGTIIANSGVVFSTVGNVDVLTLNGRAQSLVSSITMVNTVINVPAP